MRELETTPTTDKPKNSDRKFFMILVALLVVGNGIFFAVKLNEANQANSNEGIVFAQQAVQAYDSGEFEEALDLYNQAEPYLLEDAGLFYNRALAHMALEQNDEAVGDLNRALLIDVEYAPVYLVLGDIADEQGDEVFALANYRAYIGLVGNSGQDAARVNLRIAELQQTQ